MTEIPVREDTLRRWKDALASMPSTAALIYEIDGLLPKPQPAVVTACRWDIVCAECDHPQSAPYVHRSNDYLPRQEWTRTDMLVGKVTCPNCGTVLLIPDVEANGA